MAKDERDVQGYLARIRKTIADSESLVSKVKLRIAETDRMLEQQGLTREQVMAMRFSEAQMAAVDAELKRRGLDPLERWSQDDEAERMAEAQRVSENMANDLSRSSEGNDPELENRQRKFGMMMKPFQL